MGLHKYQLLANHIVPIFLMGQTLSEGELMILVHVTKSYWPLWTVAWTKTTLSSVLTSVSSNILLLHKF